MARRKISVQTSRAFSPARSLYYKRIVFFYGIKDKKSQPRLFVWKEEGWLTNTDYNSDLSAVNPLHSEPIIPEYMVVIT